MNVPILITAFGTSPAALSTYSHLDHAIRPNFPGHEIIWSYSSRLTTRQLPPPEVAAYSHPEKIMRQLAERGYDKVLVQPLHLLPGIEFHDLQRDIRQAGIPCVMGMPLLCTPQDFDEFREVLRPTIIARQNKAILILGHGSTHPIWTAYFCLEKIFRHNFGERIFVGALEKFPESSNLPAQIKAAGFSEVCIIPFLLIAGMHYHRDIVGDGPASWTSRLHSHNIAVETIDHGLGLFPGLENLLIRHINEGLGRNAISNPQTFL